MEAMNEDEARQFLEHNKFGVLGLADGGRAYALPLFYGWDGANVYFHAHPGEKTRWFDATEEVCFVVVRTVTLDDWVSVMVYGRIEPVVESGRERDRAEQSLMSVPLPPRFGRTETGEPKRANGGKLVYRLVPTRITGRRSTRPEMTQKEKQVVYGGA